MNSNPQYTVFMENSKDWLKHFEKIGQVCSKRVWYQFCATIGSFGTCLWLLATTLMVMRFVSFYLIVSLNSDVWIFGGVQLCQVKIFFKHYNSIESYLTRKGCRNKSASEQHLLWFTDLLQHPVSWYILNCQMIVISGRGVASLALGCHLLEDLDLGWCLNVQVGPISIQLSIR